MSEYTILNNQDFKEELDEGGDKEFYASNRGLLTKNSYFLGRKTYKTTKQNKRDIKIRKGPKRDKGVAFCEMGQPLKA